MLAGYPVQGVRVRLFDGAYHSVDSSEIAFKLAGMQAMKQALRKPDPVLLEPIMLVTLSVPEANVGDVIGDLNGRRGRPQGMEPVGAMTEIKAEVPMAEMLTYAPDLRSITQGQGDYTLEFLRYEEVPGHLAQKVVADAGAEQRGCARLSRSDGVPGGHALAARDPSARASYPDCQMTTRTIVTSQPDVAVRRVRAPPAARRAARLLHRRRPAPDGLRAVRAARRPRGLAARDRRGRGGDAAPDAPAPRAQPARPLMGTRPQAARPRAAARGPASAGRAGSRGAAGPDGAYDLFAGEAAAHGEDAEPAPRPLRAFRRGRPPGARG